MFDSDGLEMESRLTSCCYLILQALAVVTSFRDDANCVLHCPLQNRTHDILYEVGCGPDCQISQCLRGCSLWEQALEASCQAVCNGTQELLPPKELYCVMGCNDALDRYLQSLKEELGTPHPPALVADSLTSTSLRLEWKRSAYPSELTAVVQWSLASDQMNLYDADDQQLASESGKLRDAVTASPWQYARNQSWDPSTDQVSVWGLRPYTNYRFRVTLIVQDKELSSSSPSVAIGTLPGGKPSSTPSHLRATVTDPTRVSVSWRPGSAPNGPILSYVLAVEEVPHGYKAHKDIPASDKKEFYTFQGLSPSKNYSVSVSMRNAVGLGPSASVFVTTPHLSQAKDDEKIILILGSHHAVISQAADMVDEPVVMYRSPHKIRGVAIHIRKGILFISDSLGQILVTPSRNAAPGGERAKVLLAPENLGQVSPHGLSIDWLNDQLYILGQVGKRWQVARCELDGSEMTVAIAGLLEKPLHMEVDPYNGYLFWVMEGIPKGGLYRLDMADISNGVKHEVIPDLIFHDSDLGAFTVDHANFRILVPSHSKNTVLAVSLDGKEITDLRHNTQKPQFSRVLSLTMANGLFYWTNGERILTEEYHNGQDSYFHNLLVTDMIDPGYVSIGVDLPSAQPVPSPVNPPTGLQAIMGTDHIRASWNVPHLLGGQGKGAWQNWSYEVRVENGENGTLATSAKSVRGTASVVSGLVPRQLYAVRVAATTSAGVGPWSARFTGRTLSDAAQPATLVWATAEGGVVSSDATGHSLTTYVHRDLIKEWRESAVYILDLAWYEDVMFLVTNNSAKNGGGGGAFVMSYNTTSKEHHRLSHLDHQAVGSIAVDWVGRRLYWANPKQQLITRGSLSGTDQEPLPILTVAKELNVDSTLGFIYWSTGHAVECSRLNGRQRRVYYPAELFSGKQVMGLTLDSDSRMVYWIVRNYEGSVLFNAHMADGTPRKELILSKVILTQYADVQGPLMYFDQRLYWVRDSGQAVVGDLTGLNSALMTSPSLEGITALTVINSRRVPGGAPGFVPQAIPDAVNVDSIKVVGDHETFNLTWSPVGNVNFGTVFYEIKLLADNGVEAMAEVVTPAWPYPSYESLPPYTKMEVTLRALTYWGGSPPVTKVLRSPQAAPSEPTRVRVFVNILDKGVEVILRWDPPARPNGILIGYNVVCWLSGSDAFLFNARDVPLDKLSFTTREIPFNTTAFFQVRACTSSGCGPPTRAVPARTDRHSPVPFLLAATSTSIILVDDDRSTNVTIARFSAASSFSSIDFRPRPTGGTDVYWIDEGSQSLFRSTSPYELPLKVLSLNDSSASGLAVDWVSNSLFWIEFNSQNSKTSINKLKLTSLYRFGTTSSPETIYSSPLIMRSVQTNPFMNSIYWYEDRLDKPATIWTATTEGLNRRPFFGAQKRERRTCNCPADPRPGPVFTLDHLSTIILWIDVHSKTLVASDLDACTCNTIVDFIRQPSGYPVSSITTDHGAIYWSTVEEKRMYKIYKKDLRKYSTVPVLYNDESEAVGSVTAFGRHLRPLPEYSCLNKHNSVAQPPTIVGRSSRSLKLRFQPSRLAGVGEKEEGDLCSTVSLPTPVYTLYYQTVESNCSEDLTSCIQLETAQSEVEIKDLMPYTQYILILDETNEFADISGSDIRVSSLVVAQTAPGAPSVVENMTAEVLNPTTLEVSWTPPTRLNSEGVTYEVHWSTGDVTVMGGTRQRGDQRVPGTIREETGRIRTRIFRLSPESRYLIWVRAFSEGSIEYSESEQIEAITFPDPRNLTLMSATAYSLDLAWHRDLNLPYISHELEYADGSTGDWGLLLPVNTSLTSEENDNSTWEITWYSMTNLKPKTVYTFRLKIYYKDSQTPFFWPPDNRFIFKTSGDRPSLPGPPVVHHLGSGKGEAQLVWEASKDNGAPVKYELEAMPEKMYNEVVNKSDFETNKTYWMVLYENTDNHWVVNGLDSKGRYRFRVRGQNDYGRSDYAYSNGPLDTTALAIVSSTPKGQTALVVLLWVLTPAAVALALLLFTCVLYRHERTKKWAQTVNGSSSLGGLPRGQKGPDVELASLRQIPRWSAHVQSSNVLYSAGTLAPVSLLPHLRRDQITLTKFLGSGAFGEVFEGLAKSLPESPDSVTKVAVKTLRKGANENEKSEFLKEAQLMSNFKHAHILQLLGVCLDNDPHFIIMELMEGGDLLSYLRASRPLMGSETALNLNDLVSMCVDVGRGCCYLEEMHFVHRDLACRNCLVSSRTRENRIVKIGDFGLARDIYKNDYYRKEGEGLLPVRWMSPESLVDGVFTSQSDVWAFGVLLWEIMSLGQQPYPARNNLEVLHYVRIGGRLGQPFNSDSRMYDLMAKCWSFNPDDRPTFKYCLQILEDILASTPDEAPLAVGPLQNGARRRSGRNQDDDFAIQHSDGDTSASSLVPGGPPKYLELVYDPALASLSSFPASPDDAVGVTPIREAISDVVDDHPSDGYEIPRSLDMTAPTVEPLQSEEATRLLSPSLASDDYSNMTR